MRLERIDDLGDARVADYRDLQDKSHRDRQGLFIVESRAVVRRLLVGSRFGVRSILLTQPALESLRDVLDRLDAQTPVYLASQRTVQGVVGFKFHRGCVAVGERAPELSWEALLGAPHPPPRLVAVLEDLANPDNVGGVFRNLAAFGAEAAFLSPGCADPLYRKAIRVSVGGSLSVPFARMPDWPASLGRLSAAGFTIVALTPHSDQVDIAAFGDGRPIPDRLALLLGAEGQGLSPAARAAADVAVRIDMAPGVNSLNVATASGIALHRFTAGRI